MTLSEIMQRVADDPACRVFPARGVPDVSPRGLTLPPDLKTFYQTCGGVELFANATFGFRIVGLDEFVPSNPVLLGDYYRSNKNEIDADESSAWYLLARGNASGQFVVIDLGVKNNGKCYDGNWEVYATQNSKVVARSFVELLERLYRASGTDLYWAHSSFDLGNAYD